MTFLLNYVNYKHGTGDTKETTVWKKSKSVPYTNTILHNACHENFKLLREHQSYRNPSLKCSIKLQAYTCCHEIIIQLSRML